MAPSTHNLKHSARSTVTHMKSAKHGQQRVGSRDGSCVVPGKGGSPDAQGQGQYVVHPTWCPTKAQAGIASDGPRGFGQDRKQGPRIHTGSHVLNEDLLLTMVMYVY